MKITLADKAIAWLALLSGLSISAVAVYYSVAGLISIFAAAAFPIAIMGITLESSKLVATVWLKQNWFIAPRFIKTYLLIAVIILMLITSMGIFGYLSKAHLDQAVPTGEIAAQVSAIDEKIKTQKENIEAARKALSQMDAAVDQTLARSTTENGASRSAAMRRSQQKERTMLQADIVTYQKNIATLNEERAPKAGELRKVEAEVGPIKYIAAFIYGDDPDTNTLERAVRWMIILIVIIFDPLAVVLLLASQYSFQWMRKAKDEIKNQTVVTTDIKESVSAAVVEQPTVTIEPALQVIEVEQVPEQIATIVKVESATIHNLVTDSAIYESDLAESNLFQDTMDYDELVKPKQVVVEEPIPVVEASVEELYNTGKIEDLPQEVIAQLDEQLTTPVPVVHVWGVQSPDSTVEAEAKKKSHYLIKEADSQVKIAKE